MNTKMLNKYFFIIEPINLLGFIKKCISSKKVFIGYLRIHIENTSRLNPMLKKNFFIHFSN